MVLKRLLSAPLRGLLGSMAVLFLCASPALGAEIRGLVTDAAGKPVRGAVVKATSGPRAISRFSGADGRYEITGLQTGPYSVSVEAYGFALLSRDRNTAENGDLNFTLKPEWNAERLTAAELLTFLPRKSRDMQFLQVRCYSCHDLNLILQYRGMKAPQWQNAIRRMSMGGRADMGLGAILNPRQMDYAGQALEKYFGPNSPEPTPDKVKHLEPSDAALQATFYEYELPTLQSMPHSIVADNKGNGWSPQFAFGANKVAKLNFEKFELTEYDMPVPRAGGRGALYLGKDGRIWMPLSSARRLASIDPVTGKITVYPGEIPGAHSVVGDAKGNIWVSGAAFNKVSMFDPATNTFTYFDIPPEKELPEESERAFGLAPGEPPLANFNDNSYGVAVDSKGIVWYVQQGVGTLNRLDPATKESKRFKLPGVASSRGITVDANDIVWYSNWTGGELMKFDPRTEQVKRYKMPTEVATPYGMKFDNDGYLWTADYNGNNITRFDPRTETFVEYPLPTKSAMVRFISPDDQGRVWFHEWWTNKIGVLVPGRPGGN